MMASSICALVFDLTSEDALLNHPDFSSSCLSSLSQLIARSLASWGQVNTGVMCIYVCVFVNMFHKLWDKHLDVSSLQDMSDVAKAEVDLLEIVAAGLSLLGLPNLSSSSYSLWK